MSKSGMMYPREAVSEWLKDKKIGDNERAVINELVDVLFFASLGREEGQPVRVHVALHPEGIRGLESAMDEDFGGSRPTWDVIPLEPMPLTVKELVKMSPALGLERAAVAVGPHDGKKYILGLARLIKWTNGGDALIFSTPEPGCIVMTREGKELFRYDKGCYIPAAQSFTLSKLLGGTGVVHCALKKLCSALIRELEEIVTIGVPILDIIINVKNLVGAMVAAGNGGIIAISPDNGDIKYGRVVHKAYELRGALIRDSMLALRGAEKERFSSLWNDADPMQEKRDEHRVKNSRRSLNSLIKGIGYLTAVDNALLLGPDLTFLGAGYAIPTGSNDSNVPDVYMATDLEGTKGDSFDLKQHGSRHRAAACFAHENPGGLVFIVSQDGPLRCMLRPEGQEHVLLWNLRLPVI